MTQHYTLFTVYRTREDRTAVDLHLYARTRRNNCLNRSRFAIMLAHYTRCIK